MLSANATALYFCLCCIIHILYFLQGQKERVEEDDEYSHIAFEDEYDEDTRSLESNEDEEEVKSTFHTN